MTVKSGQTLSHYRLIEKIGEGGMGVVWRAQDAVLGRTVAIKVLPADSAGDETRRRMFLEEARLASSVSDAHIAQVHELGREGDLDFIVMEYVEGQALNRILNGHPLPSEKVADLGHQVAQALSRAHRKGLLHRDLKPGNILVTPDGEAKVVDFGLATLFDRGETGVAADDPTIVANDESRGWRRETPLAGTLQYMSPEQVRSEKLDLRSDIFSLGVVLYEMTTGQRPFTAATHVGLLQEILQTRPKPVHDLAPKVPLDLDRIIQKAMAPKPSDRYQSMEDLAVDLKRLGRELESGSSPTYDDLKAALAPQRLRRLLRAGVAATLVVGTAGVAGWLTRSRWGAGGPDPRTILILPMEVRGQPEGADYVGRAFAERIAVSLARSQGIKVLPVPEAGELGGSGTLQRAHAALGVGAGRLLAGTLTREGDALLASISLLDTQANRILWGATKTTKGGDFGTLASALTQEVATQLGAVFPRLYDSYMNASGSPAMAGSPLYSEALGAARRDEVPVMEASTRRLVEAFPGEPEALVLRARALGMSTWDSAPDSAKRRLFEDSLSAIGRVDPNNPWEQVFRAMRLGFDERYREATDLFTRVLERDDLMPAARAVVLSSRAGVLASAGNTGGALEDLEEAIRLDPTNYKPLMTLSWTLRQTGRFDEELSRARQAMALNPNSFQTQVYLAQSLADLGRWEEALAPARKALALSETSVQSSLLLGVILDNLGKPGEALAPLLKACQASKAQDDCAMYAIALRHAGDERNAEKTAAEAASGSETPGGAYGLASYKAVAGDRREALRLLRRYLDLYRGPNPLLAANPYFLSLHGDPEFETILGELKKRLEAVGGGSGTRP